MRWPQHALVICTAAMLSLPTFFAQAHGDKRGVDSETLLESERSWDGTRYSAYPQGTPQLSVLKITIAPNSSLDWHQHPIPNAAYVQSGVVTIEKKSSGEKRQVTAGEVLPEVVDIAHRGYTTQEGAVLIVFYAGKKGVPLSEPVK
ncbi:cupin [Serratia sp. MYb239]|uniref:cupin domain-containing protein n=1 Tax=Serratia sp. MYb239 TaxID=2033438 RepID=UPI000CF6878A|nr:cupin domain-containing protein [Serratia sp. MYb239]AVJ18461.1 cupin [Serratia sp. MYb239]